MMFPLEGIRAGLAGSDTHDLLEIENKDLAVADLAGVRGFFHRLNNAVEQLGYYRRLDLDLGQKIDDILRASIELGMPLLSAEALDLGNRDPLHADCR